MMQPEMNAESEPELTRQELRTVLDEELARLPEKYRLPVVLCCLEGKTYDEAGRMLRCPQGTFSYRMSRGRELLRQGLARRGLALSSAAFAGALADSAAAAALPSGLLEATLDAAVGRAGAATSAGAVSLAETYLASAGFRLRLMVALFLLVCVAGSGMAGLLWSGGSDGPANANQASPARESVFKDRPTRTDPLGDPLPPDALLRLGTLRLRHAGGSIGWGTVILTSDGTALSGGSGDKWVRMWEVPAGKELRRFGGMQLIYQLALSPDGALVAAAGMHERQGIVNVWETATGKERHRILIEAINISALKFTPDGKGLRATITADGKGAVVTFDPATGKEITRRDDWSAWRRAPQFTPDAQTLAGWINEDTLQLRDITTGKVEREFKGIPYMNGRITFSPDGKLMAAAGSTGQKSRAVLWDRTTGKELAEITGHTGGARALAFSPDGNRLASGGGSSIGNGDLIVRDVPSGKPLWTVSDLTVNVVDVAFAPDAKLLATYGSDGSVRYWDAATGKDIGPPALHRGPIAACLSPDGKRIFTLGRDQKLCEWDASSGAEARRLPMQPLEQHYWNTGQVALSPDGTVLAVSGWRKENPRPVGIVKLFDAAGGQELRLLQPHKDWVTSFSFSPDGKSIAVACQDEAADIWDVATGKLLRRCPCPMLPVGNKMYPARVHSLAYFPDGKSLIGLSYDGAFFVWDVASGKLARNWKTASHARNLVIAPNGKRLACITGQANKGVVALFDPETGREIRQFGPYPSVDTLAFSPDSQLLALGTAEYREPPWVRLIEVASGQECRRLQGHVHPATAMAFGPRGRTLLSASGDSTAVLWDTTGLAGRLTGRPLPDKELDACWADLAGSDAARAFDAVWTLAVFPEQAVPYLGERVKPVPTPDAARVKQWVADLDSAEFEVRRKAAEELERLEERVDRELRDALAAKPSLEKTQRLEELMQRLERQRLTPTGDTLRLLRVVRVLEQAGTSEARKVLMKLAAGAPSARVTTEAEASLRRMGDRPGSP